jgi:hypothetical protein
MQNPLILPESSNEELRLLASCPVGFDKTGAPIRLNSLDFYRFGKPMLPDAGGVLVWEARTPLASTAALRELHPFHFGAMITPRTKRIIEDFGAPEVEFIPLRIIAAGTRELLDEWWFVNVFHWRDIFDFPASKLKYRRFPKDPGRSVAVSAQFGKRMIVEIEELVATPAAQTGGLFLARGPSEAIWRNVFIGRELAAQINDGVPVERQAWFGEFLLKDRPKPVTPVMRIQKRRWLPW